MGLLFWMGNDWVVKSGSYQKGVRWLQVCCFFCFVFKEIFKYFIKAYILPVLCLFWRTLISQVKLITKGFCAVLWCHQPKSVVMLSFFCSCKGISHLAFTAQDAWLYMHPKFGRFQIVSCPSRATSIEMGMLTNSTLYFRPASPRKGISEEERYYILMNDYKDKHLFFPRSNVHWWIIHNGTKKIL